MGLLRVEAAGVRTAAAAVLPLITGQALGRPAPGLLVGLGGLYLSVTDKEGSTVRSLLVVFSVLAYSHVRHNYSLFVVFLTPFVVLMIETVQPTDWRIALTRVLDTLAGGLIALAVSYLLRPRAAFAR
jgi:uncharacterized membrane protein YccC